MRKGGQQAIQFCDSIEDFDTGGPSSITFRMEYLLAFQYWYCEVYVEKQLIFVFWRWNRRSNKHGTLWHVVTTGYFYVLFLWTIAVLGFLKSTITFTVNSHADNHFYKYICFKYYTRHVLTKAFLIQIWVSFEIPLLFFLIRTMIFFSADSVKIIELHIAHTWRHM